MKLREYDHLFCISSEKMPFTFRIEVTMKEPVSRDALDQAVQTAIRRYPYFAMRVEKDAENYFAVPNDKPIAVYEGEQVEPMGSEAVNGHMIALSCHGAEIDFFASHVITDGGGFMPFLKTVLYYYLCNRYHTVLDPTGIELADAPLYADEDGDPFAAPAIRTAQPLYVRQCSDFFRLEEGGIVREHNGRVFRFRVREDEMMRFSRDHDGSPAALMATLMAKAIWDVHPEADKDLVCAVSFNLRPGLRTPHNHRMLSTSVPVVYPPRFRTEDILRMCTCTRGMITLETQAENVLYFAQQRQKLVRELLAIPTLEAKKKYGGERALRDATDNTFSVSYVGKPDYGSIGPYLQSIYNITDGSTYGTAFVEVASVNGSFHIALIQGFSDDTYYRSLLRQLERCGISYTEDADTPLNTPGTVLP